jgi:hypothetical protein
MAVLINARRTNLRNREHRAVAVAAAASVPVVEDTVPVVEDTSMSASLLERIQIHKEKDATSASLMERIQYHKQNEQSGESGSLA